MLKKNLIPSCLIVALVVTLYLFSLIAGTLPNAYAYTDIEVDQPGTVNQERRLIGGDKKVIGKGTVQSWVELDKNQKPLSIGVTLTEAAIDTAPENDGASAGKDGIKLQLQDGIGHQTFEYELLLPKIADINIPFTHVGVNWNPFGHGPEGIFTPAHWDIHFYTIDPGYRHNIKQNTKADAKKSDKFPPKGFLSVDYKLAPGTAEPRMGSHTADFSSSQLEPGKFSNIFIFGIYNGETVHWEPMITDDFLKANEITTESIKLPKLYFKSGYYPTKYTVKHDRSAGEYIISLDDLQYHPSYLEQS